GAGMWVAVGADDSQTIKPIIYSTNGQNWHNIESDIGFYSGSAVKWNGSMWLAVGDSSELSGGISIMWSTDGIIWSYASYYAGMMTIGMCIEWTGTQWVVGGTNGADAVIHSTDGISWTASTGIEAFNDCRDLKYDTASNRLVAVGAGAYYSSNKGN